MAGVLAGPMVVVVLICYSRGHPLQFKPDSVPVDAPNSTSGSPGERPVLDGEATRTEITAPDLDALEQVIERPIDGLDELVRLHLGPAPAALQTQARALFMVQADHFRALAEQAARAAPSMQTLLDELDARFCERLRRVACERLQCREGLLVVGGHEYSGRIKGKYYLLWSAGASMFDTSTDVLVVLDEPDDELAKIDQAYRSVRAMRLVEQLAAFNARPLAERRAVIQGFMRQRAAGAPLHNEFGVLDSMLQFIVVDSQTMTVQPAER